MKTISANMRTHLDGTVTTLATILRLVRTDGQAFFFTDHDRDIVFDGDTYLAAVGYSRVALKNEASLSVDSVDTTLFFDATAVTETELRAGLFDRAQIHMSAVNWSDPDGDGEVKLRRGWLGECTIPLDGDTFKTELRGMTQALSQNILDVYQPECRVDLGSAKCGIPIQPAVLARLQVVEVGQFYRVATAAGVGQEVYENRIYEVTIAGTTDSVQPSYDTTVGNATVDGTATLTAREAWTRHAVVDTVTSRRVFTITVTDARAVDGWFDGGAVRFDDGNNAGISMEVKRWVDSSGLLTLFLPMPFDVVPGDKFSIYAGCDKRRETCFTKFNNVINFRGEPDLPGLDALKRIKSGE